MAYTAQNKHVGSYIKLPVSEVVKAGYSATSLVVQTPHKGEVVIEIKDIHRPFFGGDTETEKPLLDLIDELQQLEREAKEHLLNEWLASPHN